MTRIEDEELASAIETVAREIVITRLKDDADWYGDWGDYPEIGENDWYLIEERVEELTEEITPRQRGDLDKAYEYLESRVDNGS